MGDDHDRKEQRPDLTAGIAEAEIPDDRPLTGRVGDELVLLIRTGDDIHALGATCSHYGGPLGDGLVVDGTVRCPWHHARFDVRTGAAVGGPALDPVPCWEVERADGRVRVRDRRKERAPSGHRPAQEPGSVVVLGGGAAGHAAVETLRTEGYPGPITVIDADPDSPYDRPQLSKTVLSGEQGPEALPLRDDAWFEAHEVHRVRARAEELDVDGRRVRLANGDDVAFDRLLIATGAEPRDLPAEMPPDARVHTLRSWADGRRLIAAAEAGRRAVVVGASFIGLEVAAALRARDVDVQIVAPEPLPLAATLGEDLGAWLQGLHESHGVTFHLGRQVARVVPDGVVLDDGRELPCDFVVVGIGVRPREELAARAGLDTDDGILVDARLQTSAPGIFAAGDVARYPDAHAGTRVRIEHWVVAQRMGQHAARAMLGAEAPFTDPPFFWTRHYGQTVSWVGAAPEWDDFVATGDPASSYAIRYLRGGNERALATVERDLENLRFEAALEADVTDVRQAGAEAS